MNTQEKIAVMQAYLDGKAIQFFEECDGKWYHITSAPSWNWSLVTYRIAPPKLVPHKHAEAIKAWADGAKIEYRKKTHYAWAPTPHPAFCGDWEYRVAP